jgi:sugar lactone lactonase YvrE
MLKRAFVVCAVLLFFVTLTTSGQQPQPASPEPPVHRLLEDFDVRDVPTILAELGVNQAQVATIVEQRVASISAATQTPAERRTRITAGRFGLPKIYQRDGVAIALSAGGKPEEIARNFLRSGNGLFLLSAAEVNDLKLIVEDVTDRAIFLVFNQTINGIDVYNAQIKFTMNRQGEIVQVATGDVVPALRLSTTPRLNSEEAAMQALRAADVIPPPALTRLADTQGRDRFVNPNGGRSTPISSELAVFPISANAGRLAYRVLVEASEDGFYEMLIDADSGRVLFRHNLYREVGQANVWLESPMRNTRQLVNFPNSSTASPSGWLAASGTVTTGNNVDAYLDANGNDQPDTTTVTGLSTGRAYSSTQLFDFSFGDGTLASDPRLFQPAAVTNLFYFVNVAHDYYYDLGFTEVAGNYQTENFGRGGDSGDAVLAESQHPSYANNAVFVPTPDGTAPKIRMGLFTRSTSSLTDDLDSSYDGQVVFHEYGHGVSTRLVGARTSVTCLDGIQSRAMGEGWSDYFSISYFNNPVEGAYLTQNSTIGVRRQSYQGYTYTYEDVGNQGYEVHRDGEIWAATLWDLRQTISQTVVDRLVVDGLKSTPCHPSMIDARDAIIAADLATNGGANRSNLWTVFARHGMGYSAVGVDGTSLSGTRYDAAFDRPSDLQPTGAPAITSNPFSNLPSVNATYQYSIAATNPASGTLAYTLSSGPTGMTVSSSGAVNWLATFTSQRVKITITDGRGGRIVHGFRLPVFTRLTDNLSQSISAPVGVTGYGSIQVPENVEVLQVTLRGGSGDGDLLVTSPDGVVQTFSGRDGNSETVSIPGPAAGEWQVAVIAYAGYSNLSLKATFLAPSTISANTTINSLGDLISSHTFYKLTVPSGASVLSVTTAGSGNVDLYLRRGSAPACHSTGVCSYDNRAISTSTTGESLSVSNPAAGTWYLNVVGTSSYNSTRLDTSTYPAVSVTTSSLSRATVGEDYSQSLAVTGGLGPFTWSVTSGSLPPGLTLSTAGTITGTPTTAGSVSFTVRARDSFAKDATASLSISVVASPAAQIGLLSGGVGGAATSGTTASVSAGYALASFNTGSAAYATAVFGYTQNGITVSEAGVPASSPLTSSRFLVEYRNGVADTSGTVDVNTGLALVNPNASAASVTYTLRNLAGTVLATGHGTLPGRSHRSRFIHELSSIASDFTLPSNFATAVQFGTLDVDSTQAISVLALRLTVNQRQEGLLSSLPVINLSQAASSSPAYFPQMADGGGYKTSINLVNNTGTAQSGTIQFFDDAGSALSVGLTSGASGSSIPYTVPASGSAVYQTNGTSSSVRVGSMKLVPNASNTTPEGAVVFSSRGGGILLTESGVSAVVPTTLARLYVDTTNGHNTGIAISNTANTSNVVTVRAYQADGTTPVGTSAQITLPVNGHRSAFAGELISGLPAGFTGVLELSSSSSFAALTLRSLINGRGDFLLTTFPVADMNQAPPNPVVLPQIANGGGYRTEFIFIGTTSAAVMTVTCYGDDGEALQIPSSSTVSNSSLTWSFNPGIVLTVAGGAGPSFDVYDNGPATSGFLSSPQAFAFDSAGNMYIADTGNERIRKVTPSGIITTLAGTGVRGQTGDGGPATSARLATPSGVAVDAFDNVYIVDTANAKIRKVSTDGIITTVVGTGVRSFSGDGGPATMATLDRPLAVAFDAYGNLYIADYNNYAVRKVSASGVITTLVRGSNADWSASKIATDAFGNVYVSIPNPDSVRKISAAGVVTELLDSQQVDSPLGMAFDPSGNLYLADSNNDRILRISTSGSISTVAGIGPPSGFSGDGGPASLAKFNSPHAVAFDAVGNLYIADTLNGRIRKVTNVP